MAIDDPSIQTDHAAGNLDSIIKQAGSQVIEQNQQVTAHEEGKRREAGAEIEASRQGTPEQNVAFGIITAVADIKSLGDAAELISERMDAASKPSAGLTRQMDGFISDHVETFDEQIASATKRSSFPITDRAKNVSKFFTGESDAMDDKVKPKTNGMAGKEDIQVTYASKLLNQQKYDQALALQRDYSAQLAHRQMAMGIAPTLGGSPRPGMMAGPSGPNFKELEDNQHSWAGYAGTT